MYPEYHLPRPLIIRIALDLLLGQRRSFRADAQMLTATLGNQVQIEGLEHLPVDAPYVVTMNHYYREGFGVWWLAAAVGAKLPEHAHMVMTGELTRWHPPLGRWLSIFALPRAARMYGFTSMPPMPPRPEDAHARAESVRRVLNHVNAVSNAVVLLAPEGRDNLDGGSLAWPPQGVGRFLLLLARRGLSVVPVGGWEADGMLQIRFGAGHRLDVPHHLQSDEKDCAATQTVMQRIAVLLPDYLRGDFA